MAYHTGFGERMRAFLLARGSGGRPLSARSAARIVGNYAQSQGRRGPSHASLSDWANDKVPADADALRLFADAFKEPRVPWLESAGYLPTVDDVRWDRERYGTTEHALDGMNRIRKIGSIYGERYLIESQELREALSEDRHEELSPMEWAGVQADGVVKVTHPTWEPYARVGDLLMVRRTCEAPEGALVIVEDGTGVRLKRREAGDTAPVLGVVVARVEVTPV